MVSFDEDHQLWQQTHQAGHPCRAQHAQHPCHAQNGGPTGNTWEAACQDPTGTNLWTTFPKCFRLKCWTTTLGSSPSWQFRERYKLWEPEGQTRTRKSQQCYLFTLSCSDPIRQVTTSSSSACHMIWTVLNWFYLMIGTYCRFPPAFQVMSPTLYPLFGWEFVVPSCCCRCSESWDERLEPARSQTSLRWAGKHRTSGFGTNFGTKCRDSPPRFRSKNGEHDDFPSELSSSYSHPTVIPKWMMFPLETLRGTVGGLGNSVGHWDSSKHLWPGPSPNYPQPIQVVVPRKSTVPMGNSPANWYGRSFNGKLQFSTWGFPNAMFDYWIGGQPLPVSFIPFVEMWSE